MANRLKSGTEWLASKLKAYAADAVTYTRDGVTATVKAVKGQSLLQLQDEYGGVAMERTDADFLIAAADLAAAGITAPERHDFIVDAAAEAGKTLTYQVSAPGGEPCWRWEDNERVIMRVHAKLKTRV